TQEQFGALVGGYRDLLTETLGVKPMDRGKDNASVVKAHVLQWNKPPSVYLLEYSFEKENKGQGKAFQAEFVRLRVYPIPKQAMVSELGMRANVPLSRESLVRNLRTEAGGDVVLRNVPMVDQGPKGYCVVASCERVLRYLGLEVDQHEMAAVAESRAREGTSYLKMLEGLKRMTGRLKVRTREVLSWNGEEFERMLADYNRAAKKAKKAEINLAGLRVIDLAEVYGAMDPVILKESRSAPGKAGYGKFQRAVAETLARGVPLLWTVELGLYEEPERPAQGRGGHMRLIIGYNSRTQEILFSDSWGERHALKRMPMDCAYAMTTGMCFLEPIP
ncbi:MAG: hypothetical protein RLZZ244_2335, partial [Verrucomicrobiota bacterium]